MADFALEHCKGRDFQTAFTRIGEYKSLTDAPFMALTALAPSNIESAIAETRQLQNAAVMSHQLDRPNIYLSLSKQKFKCKFSTACNVL